MITVSQIAHFLGAHRPKNDTFDQNVDSWYCTCNGIRTYRSQFEVEQKHIAPKLHKLIKEAHD